MDGAILVLELRVLNTTKYPTIFNATRPNKRVILKGI